VNNSRAEIESVVALANKFPNVIQSVVVGNEVLLRGEMTANDLAATLVTPERRTPAYLAGFVKSEWDKWGAAIRAGGAIPK